MRLSVLSVPEILIKHCTLYTNFFLSDRKQFVCINQVESRSFDVSYGVPQGSCLGPVLFLFYASKSFEIVSKHLPNSHGYADDSQLYLSFRPDSQDSQDEAVKCVQDCITDARAWRVSQKMRFNDFKTEFLNVGTYHQLRKVDMDSARVGEVDIIPVKSVRNSGAWSDENMSMDCNILSQVVIMNFTLSKCTEAYIHSIYM